ncbi:Cell surface protein [Myxococcus hansupus]|uniref:Cell surface protein n=1 Tax=Pseudomyxococcus hansupus TaxID=1297742 RepID=A0A0H4XC59_9BACT|nr:MYXO-CTERM sorting domain-containing protein [Myxococcus hansupus]AKQ65542.1 Cell surface protein [Myxococcus hansupus]
MLRTLALSCWLLPPLALATTPAPRTLTGTLHVVAGGPGDQTDPHVSGPWVAYTNESRGTSEIRYHDLRTSTDAAIPNEGAFDFVSDISGSTIVFTRVSTSSAIYVFDVGSDTVARELAPEAGSSRRSAVIGGRTVAWQDFGYTGVTSQPEIAAFDLDHGTLTRLTDDTFHDRTPAVSPDGATVVWAKCDEQGLRCDIWQARRGANGFTSQALTGSEGEESHPDTNGEVAVYASTRTLDGVTDRDIYWKPLNGGTEQRLALPGMDANPSISGSLIAFERRDPAKNDFDIVLYDMNTETLYAITNTPENESLTDLSVDADGTVRVVWTVSQNGDFNVHAFTFKLDDEPGCKLAPVEPAVPAEVCARPGDWPMLASLEVARTSGQPNGVALGFAGTGDGVLCVDNGYNGEDSTAGWVWLNGRELVDPSRFKPGVPRVATRAPLDGHNSLTALISGRPGSAFRIRVYGPPRVCQPLSGTPTDATVIPGFALKPVSSSSAPVSPMTFIPEGPVRDAGLRGCSTGGGPITLSGVILLLAGLLRPRRAKALRRGDGAL